MKSYGSFKARVGMRMLGQRRLEVLAEIKEAARVLKANNVPPVDYHGTPCYLVERESGPSYIPASEVE